MENASAPCLAVGGVNLDVLGRVSRLCGPDEAVDLDPVVTASGGHAGNFASAIRKLGGRVRLLSCVGKDPAADAILQDLELRGVDLAFMQRSSLNPTGSCFVPVLPDGSRALYMARGANRRLSLSEVRDAATGCNAIVIFDPPADELQHVPAVIENRLCIFAPGGLLVNAAIEVLAPMLQVAHCLVVNYPESTTLTKEARPEVAAAVLAENWRLSTVVTLGDRGCVLARPGKEVLHISGYRVEVADTTGAGDAAVAGLCFAMQAGMRMEAACRVACAAGALAVRRLGAQEGIGTWAEVAALIDGSQGELHVAARE